MLLWKNKNCFSGKIYSGSFKEKLDIISMVTNAYNSWLYCDFSVCVHLCVAVFPVGVREPWDMLGVNSFDIILCLI